MGGQRTHVVVWWNGGEQEERDEVHDKGCTVLTPLLITMPWSHVDR